MTDKVQCYLDEDEYFNPSGKEAVIIVPLYSHLELAEKAFAKGMHFLLEKPGS